MTSATAMAAVFVPPTASRRLVATLVASLAVLSAACGGRRPPLPDVAGPLLADVVVRASLADTDGAPVPPPQPLLLDSVSFARLGAALGREPFSLDELHTQVGRAVEFVDPTDVLECPRREPCRVVRAGTYIEIWEAERSGADLELVVGRIANVQALYVLTRSTTHRIVLRSEAGGWRLIRRELLPS